MAQEIEIEFKNLLTKEEFLRLQKRLRIKETDFFKQVNHYFDTEEFLLKSHGSALRVREKKGKTELTLKEPAGEGLLETTQKLNNEEKETMLKMGTLPEGPVKEQLLKYKFPLQNLTCFGTLTTERAEKPYRGGTVVLDYSSYLNKHDYEIEFETKDGKTGQKIFQELLQAENIPIRKTANKIRRFYEEKMRQARNKV